MISFNNWKEMNLKVGKILEVNDHPNADKLLVIKVDIGDEIRTIVAGLKNHYTKKELLNKKVVIFTNLEQKELRGIKSEGMILAAVKDEKVILIAPEKNIDNGAVIQ
jgi:methionyl-tRNA synthetase